MRHACAIIAQSSRSHRAVVAQWSRGLLASSCDEIGVDQYVFELEKNANNLSLNRLFYRAIMHI
jgi:hypothetical protein